MSCQSLAVSGRIRSRVSVRIRCLFRFDEKIPIEAIVGDAGSLKRTSAQAGFDGDRSGRAETLGVRAGLDRIPPTVPPMTPPASADSQAARLSLLEDRFA